MFQQNLLQFAVTREDPRVEAALLSGLSAPRVLVVASGGCTPLALQARYPGASFCLVDANPAQLDHVRARISARAAGQIDRLTRPGPDSLLERGNFEALFRLLRATLHDFVAPPDAWERLLSPGRDPSLLSDLLEGPWWTTAFEVAFCDPLLRRMFGPAALQHAAPGTYPGWFRRQIEAGILRPDHHANPFLAHILLGRYPDHALPDWLAAPPPPAYRFEYRCARLQEIADWADWDLIQLSNAPDWMDTDESRALLSRIGQGMRPGARLVIRQINNRRRLEAACTGLRFDPRAERALLAQDRSLFYARILVGERR